MADLGIGAGLAAMAFWGFVAVAVIAGVWDGIRKREVQHETVRRLIEGGQAIDQETLDKLLSLTKGDSDRHDRALFITALWVFPVAMGLAVFALVLGHYEPDKQGPLLGVSALLGVLGVGFYLASKIAARLYVDDDNASSNQ